MTKCIPALSILFLGFFVRQSADFWSRNANIPSFQAGVTITAHFYKERFDFLQDLGAVLLGLGTLMLAAHLTGLTPKSDSPFRQQ